MSVDERLRRPAPLRRPEDYKIAIITALAKEKDAVDAILEHSSSLEDAEFEVSDDDDNDYDFGILGNHHIVVTMLPGMGKVRAASAAANMKRSFPGIKLCLLVGICGIVPLTVQDDGSYIERFLGDVVIAEIIVQYDFGRGTEAGFVRKSTVRDVPGRPSTKVQNVLRKLETTKGKKELERDLRANLEALLSSEDMSSSGYPSPEQAPDLAFSSKYFHRHAETACPHENPTQSCDVKPPCPIAQRKSCLQLECDLTQVLPAERHPTRNKPRVFVGSVGVADLVQKSAKSRDAIAAEEGVIAFEMESVGIWDTFPDVVVIKAACDYADSHKNDAFHCYASATSAACAKAFLSRYRLRGNVCYDDEPSDSHAAGGRGENARGDLPSQATRVNNVYSGEFRGSTFGDNSTVNNSW